MLIFAFNKENSSTGKMKKDIIHFKNNSGEKKELEYDSELLQGLWLCVDQNKVNSNAAQMGIILNTPDEEQNVVTHIDHYPNCCIISMLFEEGHFLQYLCQKKLDLEKLDQLNPKQLPPDIKAIIREAMGAPKKIVLGDFFKK